MEMRKWVKQCTQERTNMEGKRVDCFENLDDELLWRIFILLPPEFLRYKIKCVCKRWFAIINNSILLNHASLIVQRPAEEGKHVYETRLVHMGEETEEFKIRKNELFVELPCKGRIRSWCNELLLIMDSSKLGGLYIFNLVNKEGSTLPQCSSYCEGHGGCKCGLSLAFDKFTGVYKIVHVFSNQDSAQCEMLTVKCELLSFNCSDWKKIDWPSYIWTRNYYWDDPVSIEGRFLHWDVYPSTYILSMDIAKGTLYQTYLPENANSYASGTYSFTEMGGFLALVLPLSETQVELWILKDFHRTVWEKLQCTRNLSYVSSYRNDCRIHSEPVASMKNGSIIIFKKKGLEYGYYAYYWRSDVMLKLEIGIEEEERCLVKSTTICSR